MINKLLPSGFRGKFSFLIIALFLFSFNQKGFSQDSRKRPAYFQWIDLKNSDVPVKGQLSSLNRSSIAFKPEPGTGNKSLVEVSN